MAELADALGSGLSERKLVRVQVPPSAPQGTASSGKADSLKGEFLFCSATASGLQITIALHATLAGQAAQKIWKFGGGQVV